MMNADALYQALKARDSRFDGRFFVGVTSTGVYCRPICPSRTPRAANCRFFPSAAAAEHAGFRPCLRCRPETAPSGTTAPAGEEARLSRLAADLIDAGVFDEEGLEGIASRMGMTPRHLRRLFTRAFGVAPVAYAQTQRLLLAKRLLTETRLPVTDVAFSSGFSSLRRFHALFRQRYGMTPTDLRKGTPARPQALVLRLAYRPPLDWRRLALFLAKRSIPGVEAGNERHYRRSVRLSFRGKHLAGKLEVRPAATGHALELALDSSLLGGLPQVLLRVRRLFDLGCTPDQVETVLGPLAAPRPGLRVPGAFDGFEMAVRAVLGQQISVKAARTLAGRFVARFGERLPSTDAEVTHLFPLPERVAGATQEEFSPLGITSRRAETLVALARALVEERFSLDPGPDVERTLDALQRIPGVGPWTAQYIAMRALAWPDAFPDTDLAVRRAMERLSGTAGDEQWRPWRAYAVMHLWCGLEEEE
jgi:AraC family transcriptional regulator of adaptative response / DNA-3-methyladenine glycosylase II